MANDKDVTAAIDERFLSLRMTDEAGMESDLLEVVLADHDPLRPIQIPQTGTELELFLGYDGILKRMGLFVFDEYELSGWPGLFTIRARATVYESTPKGKTDLQSQKNRSWPNGTKLSAMVAKIAKEHGMAPAVSPSLANIAMPHFDQTEESDISFLLRILRMYDAVVKPTGGKLVVVKRGEQKTSSGASLPAVTLQAKEASGWRMSMSARESAGTVVAYWHAKKQSRRNMVSVGSGEPVLRLRHYYPTEDAATRAAQAALDRRKRGQEQFSCTMSGNTDLMAEGPLHLIGFRAGVDGEWVIKRVEHDLGDGYICRITAERPNRENPQEE